jgi:hypothetical protein
MGGVRSPGEEHKMSKIKIREINWLGENYAEVEDYREDAE